MLASVDREPSGAIIKGGLGVLYPHPRDVGLFFLSPRLNQTITQVARGLDQECSRPHRRVADGRLQQSLWTEETPFILEQSLGGAVVDHRLQRMLNDRFGQDTRCVMRSCCPAIVPRGDVETSDADDPRFASPVAADQSTEPEDPLRKVLIGDDPPDIAVDVKLSAALKRLLDRAQGARSLDLLEAFRKCIDTVVEPQLEIAQRNFRLYLDALLHGSRETENDLVGASAGVLQQLLVDVSNLLDIERAERDTPRFALGPADLDLKQHHRLQHVEHFAVVDTKRFGGIYPPVGSLDSPFQKREAIGVKKRPTIGGKAHAVVRAAPVDEPEGREHLAPGIFPLLENRLDILRASLAQTCEETGHRIVLVVDFVVAEEWRLLILRVEQEDGPHHHGQRGLIDDRFRNALEQSALLVGIGAIDPGDEQFHSLANLAAELNRDIGLGIPALVEERGQCLLIRHTEEATLTEQRAERDKRQVFLEPEIGEPGREA